MKTIVTTFALSLALCAAAEAAAQPGSAAPATAADSTLLSETIDGDYMVRRFMVRNDDDSDYSVRYQINMSRLSAAFASNSRELEALNAFVENLMRDSLADVRSVRITGYASPDGPEAFNRTLAKNRALDFKNYIDRKYGFSKRYDVALDSQIAPWSDCRPAVAQSTMAERQAVLEVIDGPQPSEAKQAALKAMPAAVWHYLANQVLPPLRRVEMTINYDRGSVVEQRTMIACPEEPAPDPCAEQQPCGDPTSCCDPCCEVIDENITGIIVEMPEPLTDFGAAGHGRHDAVRTDADVRHDARVVDRLARKETRAAERAARKVEKEARKAAKAESEAARKLR